MPLFFLDECPRETRQGGRLEFRLRLQCVDRHAEKLAELDRRAVVVAGEKFRRDVDDIAFSDEERFIRDFLRRNVIVGTESVPAFVEIRLDVIYLGFRAIGGFYFRAGGIDRERHLRNSFRKLARRHEVERMITDRALIRDRPGVDDEFFPFGVQAGARGGKDAARRV